jgi:DNA-binding transcriptional ArsR family regulator
MLRCASNDAKKRKSAWYHHTMIRINTSTDPDIAATAALIGDRSRATMLSVLSDGRCLPAGDLARAAGIAPQTASTHLDRLLKGNLIVAEPQGRHRYYRLRDPRVADLLELLAVVAPPPPALAGRRDERVGALQFARTCYGHLAGVAGVAVARALCDRQYLRAGDACFHLTAAGAGWFRGIGIDPAALKRRPLLRRCIDWSERRYHLAGALGVAFTSHMFEAGWIARARTGRAVHLTDQGCAALRAELGVELSPRPRSEGSSG